jgi:hypothetical protein
MISLAASALAFSGVRASYGGVSLWLLVGDREAAYSINDIVVCN